MARWRKSDRDIVIELRRKGVSFGAIARQIGRSRNAVIGLIWRSTHPALAAERKPGRAKLFTHYMTLGMDEEMYRELKAAAPKGKVAGYIREAIEWRLENENG